MNLFENPDKMHFQAAQGWIELGNALEANEELERLTPGNRAHPDVLKLRWEVYAATKRWEMALQIAQGVGRLAPEDSWSHIHIPRSLNELKRTQEAYAQLAPVAEKFPDEWRIPYNLACYCAQLGRFDEAKEWFKRAMRIDKKPVQAGIDDPDLQPLWDSFSGTLWKKI